MIIDLKELHDLPANDFYVTLNGRIVDDWTILKNNDNFQVHLRVLGGKGGFGSLLRSFGSQFYKSTNQDMCRDLSGRRLKDVKEEERLKKFISKAAQREQEKQRKLDEKYKRLKQLDERKHEFNDTEYSRQKEKILEETEEALLEGLKAIQSAPNLSSITNDDDGPGTSGVSSTTTITLGKRKRDDNMAISVSSSTTTSLEKLPNYEEPKAKKQKKPAGDLWLGIDGLNDSDLEDSDEEHQSDEEEEKESHIASSSSMRMVNAETVEVKKTG